MEKSYFEEKMKQVVAAGVTLKSTLRDLKDSSEFLSYLTTMIIRQTDAMHEVKPGRVPIGLNIAIGSFRASFIVCIMDDGSHEIDSITLDDDYTTKVPALLLEKLGRDTVRAMVKERFNLKKLRKTIWKNTGFTETLFGDAMCKHVFVSAVSGKRLGETQSFYGGEHKGVCFRMTSVPMQIVATLPWEALEKDESPSKRLRGPDILKRIGVIPFDEDDIPQLFIAHGCERMLTPKWFTREDLVDL